MADVKPGFQPGGMDSANLQATALPSAPLHMTPAPGGKDATLYGRPEARRYTQCN